MKLSDFGFAKVDDGTLMTPHFTPYYVAPQVMIMFSEESHSSTVDIRVITSFCFK